MSLTLAIAEPRHRGLLYGALIWMLAAALLLMALGLLVAAQLQLNAIYVVKILALFGAGAVLALLGLAAHHPFKDFGPANGVTVVRGTLVALMAGLIGERTDSGAPLLAATIGMCVVLLDGVDGWLARRTRMTSSFGARFDMETDAVLVAVLAILAWQFGKAGAWVLLSGMLRYLFVAAALLWPLLRHPVPSSYRGKTIAVVQMIALIVAIAPVTPVKLSTAVAAAALAALSVSFLLDVVWLVRRADPS